MVYLDYAATTPLDPAVLETMLPYLKDVWGNPSSPHAKGRAARAAIDQSRQKIAILSGYKPAEVLFTGSGSESNTLAIRGVCDRFELEHGHTGHIITTETEHTSVLSPIAALEKRGWTATRLRVDAEGLIDLTDVKEAMHDDTVLLSMHWANNETGTIQPVAEIIKLFRERNILCHLDALQAVGLLPFPSPLPDLMSIAAHKFHGPKGIGILFARQHVNLEPLVRGGGQEQGLRCGTENTPGIVGLAKAFEIAMSELQVTSSKLKKLSDYFIEHVTSNLELVTLNGSKDHRLPSIVNLHVSNHDGAALVIQLDQRGICVSTGAACATGAAEPSHVLQAMGQSEKLAGQNLRVSFGKETTEAEIDHLLTALRELIR
ncbi:MAG TPA: cysteine desulfurase family protein [Candidatus Peribacteraceae bacterium]|nr:cysteine desulfurase family protein [Candidatus Peribacteraceae bacterium]